MNFLSNLFGKKKGAVPRPMDNDELFRSLVETATMALLKGSAPSEVQTILIRDFKAYQVSEGQAALVVTEADKVAEKIIRQQVANSQFDKDVLKTYVRNKIKAQVGGQAHGFSSVTEAEAVGYIGVLLSFTYPRHNASEIIGDVVKCYGLDAKTAQLHVEGYIDNVLKGQ
jgi:hypothetical protein